MKKLIIVLMAMGMIAMASSAMAQTVTSNLNVSASVAEQCSVSTTQNIAFGAYNPVGAGPFHADGIISVTCVTGTGYRVYVPGDPQRQMTSGSDTMNYTLYLNNTYIGAEFPRDYAGAADRTATSLDPVPITLYGDIPASQDTPVGSYSDVVTATVDY
ncbi:MAG: spore coat U domain-containing protein [Syntrophobacteraceae bacterium]